MASHPRPPALLGLDVGTSAVKACLLFVGNPPAGRPRLATTRVGLRVSRARPGWSEMDPRAWWRAARRAVARLDAGGVRVLGLGLSTLFPALVAMDADGRPLAPAILYDDRRSTAEVEAFSRAALTQPALQHLLTGNVVRAGTVSLSSLLWLRKHEPEVFRGARLFGHAGTWLGRRLTGRSAIDASSASLTGLYATASGEAWLRGVCRVYGVSPDRMPAHLKGLTYGAYLDLLAAGRPGLRDQILADLPPGLDRERLQTEPIALPEGGWVGLMLDAVGLDTGRLPEVLMPPDRLGGLTREAAAALGLEPGLPVAAGAGDTVCGALGLGLADEDEVAALCGSTDSLASLQRSAVFSTRTLNVAYLDGETWLAIAPMNTTGAAVDWFVETLLGGGRRGYERFFARAAQAVPGSGGVVFLPYLAGERSPVYDPRVRGLFLGLTRRTGQAELARAVLEGVAFGHRQILRLADVRLGRPVARVVAAGGGTATALWRQIRADAADRPYRFSDCTEATALGAALLGGVAAGVFPTWRDAAAEARRLTRFEEVRPDPTAWHSLRRNFEVYESLYDALKHCF